MSNGERLEIEKWLKQNKDLFAWNHELEKGKIEQALDLNLEAKHVKHRLRLLNSEKQEATKEEVKKLRSLRLIRKFIMVKNQWGMKN